MEKIINIETSKIYSHPDNPRKDLGDLEELTASIRVNGILQNLTVLPGHWDANGTFTNDGYTALIGHRRLAAAREAGLDTVPCVILEGTDRKEQIKIMLSENIQRADLSIKEQAQSFQLMFDLGMSAKEIAEKSGFSSTTVRSRLKLAKLDQSKLDSSWSRGATLMDYSKLDAIEDIEEQNELLTFIGTPNYSMKLKEAIKKQDNKKIYMQWLSVLPTFATLVSESDYGTMEFFKSCSVSIYSSSEELKVPADSESVKYYYIVYEDKISLYKERTKTVMSPIAEYRDSLKPAFEELSKQLSFAERTAKALRDEFIKNAGNLKSNREVIMKAALEKILDTNYITRRVYMEDMPYLLDLEEDDICEDSLLDLFGTNPDKVLLVAAYSGMGTDWTYDMYHWDSDIQMTVPVYRGNSKLNALYDFLEKLGYEASDDEKALLDGTHEIYQNIKALKEKAHDMICAYKEAEKNGTDVA